MADHVPAGEKMEDPWPQHDCPDCGADCSIIWGKLWDHDFAFCPCCGWEGYLTTSSCAEEGPEICFGRTGKVQNGN